MPLPHAFAITFLRGDARSQPERTLLHARASGRRNPLAGVPLHGTVRACVCAHSSSFEAMDRHSA